LICALSLPETMISRAKTANSVDSEEPISAMDNSSLGEDSHYSGTESPRQTFGHHLVTRKLRLIIHPYVFIFNRRLLLLLFTAAIFQFAQGSSRFLAQYISERFTWTLAQANLLASVHAATSIPVFIFVLPYVSRNILQSASPPKKDLYLARLSVICLTVGSLGIGVSPYVFLLVPSLCLQAAGAGFPIVMRSLLTALVEREETARLYSTLELLQTTGNVLASLCFTGVFRLGLKMSGIWTGLVWLMASLLFALVGIAVWVVQIR
jgi:hypothetical protein